MNKLICLIFSGHALPEIITDKIFETAQEMFRENTKYAIIKEAWFEGDVRTEYKKASLAEIYGYVFDATIDWDDKTTHIQFIIRKSDLTLENLQRIRLNSNTRHKGFHAN